MVGAKGNGPREPLDPKVVRKLLDLLSTDDAFRELFQRDAHAALVQAGWVPPEGTDPSEDMAALSGGTCLQLQAGATLASADSIRRGRDALQSELSLPFTYQCPDALIG